jgi:hypothetical protein
MLAESDNWLASFSIGNLFLPAGYCSILEVKVKMKVWIIMRASLAEQKPNFRAQEWYQGLGGVGFSASLIVYAVP